MILGQDETRQLGETEVTCRNCGSPVVGAYCHRCGQHTAEHNHGLWQFVLEFCEEFVRLDSKFLRTIRPLLFRPGYLTQEWRAGKRVRYISPLKLYITLSALCFLLINLTTHPEIIKVNSNDKQSIDFAQQEIAKKEKTTNSTLQKTFLKQAEKFTVAGAAGEQNKRDFQQKFMGRLSTANLILLPIFALLFKMLYIRRSRYYVEHLVFALHYYAFFSVGAIVIVLASKLQYGSNFIIVPTVLWMVVYLPLAMLLNYCQGFFKTMVKCWIFCSIYVIAIGLVLLGMLVVTAIEMPDAKSPIAAGADSKPAIGSPIQNQPSEQKPVTKPKVEPKR